MEVAWRLEGDTTAASALKPISGEFLSAYAPSPSARFNPPTITGGQVIISWTGSGVLQESNDLSTWTTVGGNPASPYATAAADAKKFYRLTQ